MRKTKLLISFRRLHTFISPLRLHSHYSLSSKYTVVSWNLPRRVIPFSFPSCRSFYFLCDSPRFRASVECNFLPVIGCVENCFVRIAPSNDALSVFTALQVLIVTAVCSVESINLCAIRPATNTVRNKILP